MVFDQLQEKFGDLRESTESRLSSEPDGRNEGIGKTKKMLAFAVAIAATFVARQTLQASWRLSLDRDPPKNPAAADVDWNDALLWGVVSGAIVGGVRIASRSSVHGWV